MNIPIFIIGIIVIVISLIPQKSEPKIKEEEFKPGDWYGYLRLENGKSLPTAYCFKVVGKLSNGEIQTRCYSDGAEFDSECSPSSLRIWGKISPPEPKPTLVTQ